MLHHLGETAAAGAIERAIESVLGGNGPRTADIGGHARTSEVGEAIAAEVHGANSRGYDRQRMTAPKDPVTSPVPLPPSSHAKPVDSFAEASELENELRRVVRGEVRFDPGARAVCHRCIELSPEFPLAW